MKVGAGSGRAYQLVVPCSAKGSSTNTAPKMKGKAQEESRRMDSMEKKLVEKAFEFITASSPHLFASESVINSGSGLVEG